MLGGLHIEMAIEEVIGDLLEGSGWFGIFVERGVTKSGREKKFLTAKKKNDTTMKYHSVQF